LPPCGKVSDKGFAGFVAADPVQTRPTIAEEIEGKFPEYQQIFATGEPNYISSISSKNAERGLNGVTFGRYMIQTRMC